MKRFLIFILILAIACSFAYTQNELILHNISDSSNKIVTLSLEIQNKDPLVAFQTEIYIPDQFSYINGSLHLTGRESDHQISSTFINNNTIRIFAYSTSQAYFTGLMGEICSFQVKLGTIPGTYDLTLSNSIIGDSLSNNILTNSSNGRINIIAPDIEISSALLNYDRVALTKSSDRIFIITNLGNSNLKIDSFTLSHSDFEIIGNSSFIITPNNNQAVTVRFNSNVKGTYNEELFIYSDDPDEHIKVLNLSVKAYAVNELWIDNISGRSGYNQIMKIGISNMEEFVGFSFDLNLPDVMTYVPNSISFTGRELDHVISATTLPNKNVRVLSYSPTNKSFSESSGEILTLEFFIDGLGGNYPLNFINPLIGDINEDNILSDNFGATLNIASPDIYVGSNSIDFGSVSIFDTASYILSIGNNGNDTLVINDLIFFNEHYFSDAILPLIIPPSHLKSIEIHFHYENEVKLYSNLRIRSNDPDEDPFNINLSAESFIPNIVIVDTTKIAAQDTGIISVSIDNSEDFVAFQFDLLFPANLSYTGKSNLTSRSQDHTLVTKLISSGRLRIFAYSLSQLSFKGNSGTVVEFEFYANAIIGTFPIELDSVTIGNSSSENILSSIQDGIVEVLHSGPVLADFPVLNFYEDHDTIKDYSFFESLVSDPNTIFEELNWNFKPPVGFSVIEVATGWKIIPESNWNGTATIIIYVSDNDFLDSTFWQVSVLPVNDLPVILAQVNLTILEETDLVLALDRLIVNDVDNVYPDDFTLTILDGAHYSHSGDTITLDVDYYGELMIPIFVNDGTDNSDIYNIIVTVENTNELPVITGQDTISILENSDLILALDSLIVMDKDNTYPDDFTLTILAGDNYTYSGLTITPDSNFHGLLTIPVYVNDGWDNSNIFNLIVTVSNVNNPPVIVGQVTMIISEESSLILDLDSLIVTDIDNSYPDDFTLTILDGAHYSYSGDTIIPDSNYFGALSIPVYVSDGKDNSNIFTVAIMVTNINDPPVFLSVPETNAYVNTEYIYHIEVYDPDSDQLSLKMNTYSNWLDLLESNNAYIVTGIPDEADIGIDTVVISLTDNIISQYIYQSFTIEIMPTTTHPLTFNDKNVLIYPNPANKYMTVKILDCKSDIHIDIFNTQGNKMLSKIYQSSSRQFEEILELSESFKGIYLIRIIYDDNTVLRILDIE